MDVLILHYHLNPGGVTRIIEAQIEGLLSVSNTPEMMIMCGNSNGLTSLKGIKIIQNDLLNYHTEFGSTKLFSETVISIMSLIKSYLTPGTVLHCHNPNLGKNPALSMAVYKLASEGVPVVNHCHDFAEDRPANMDLLEEFTGALAVHKMMYPRFARYHYVVLNSCDFGRIQSSGILPSQLHLLPNPVFPVSDPPEGDIKTEVYKKLGLPRSKKLCTYPVRVIQRKNIGEFILLAVLFSDISNFAVTLPPRNPIEIVYYKQWKSFCEENKIDVVFEAGEKTNFEALIRASDFCITTSMREGFGMVYLEPWLFNTPVIGRALPCIIDDLQTSGIRFPRLYYNITVSEPDNIIDFKDIPAQQQQKIISRVVENPGLRKDITERNPFLQNFFDDIPAAFIEENKKIIRQQFSITAYGRQIFEIYNKLSD